MRAVGGVAEAVEAVHSGHTQFDPGGRCRVEVGGGSVQPGQDGGVITQDLPQSQPLADRGNAEVTPAGGEEAARDDFDPMTVGIGFEDAFESGRGKSFGEDRGIGPQCGHVDLGPDQCPCGIG